MQNISFTSKLHSLDISIVLIYLVSCLLFGIYKSGKIKSIKDYTVSDKNFSTFAIVATLFATYISAQYVLGKTAKIYELGLLFILPFLIQPFVWITTSLLFSKNIRDFSGAISVVDIMRSCYGEFARYVTAISSLLFAIAVLSAQTTAIGYLFEHFFGFSFTAGALIGIGLVTLYSAMGGIRSVIYTDVFQFLIFFFVIPIACGYAYFKVGGYEAIMAKLPDTHKEVNFSAGNMRYMLGLVLLFLMPFIEASYCQRLLLAKNTKQIPNSLRFVFFCAVILTLAFSIIGLIIKSEFHLVKDNMAFYYFIDYSLTTGLKGLVIVGLLAVIQSSADSWINTSSSIIVSDLIKPFFKKITDKRLLLIVRFSALFIALLAVIISLMREEILDIIWKVNNFNFPVLFIPLLAAMRKVKTNSTTFLCAFILAMTFVGVSWYFTGELEIESSMYGVLGSAIGFYLSHAYQVRKGIIQGMEEAGIYQRFIVKIKRLKLLLDNDRQNENINSLYYLFALFLIVLNAPIIMLDFQSQSVTGIPMILQCINLLLGVSLIIFNLYSTKISFSLWYLAALFSLLFISTYNLISSEYEIIAGLNFFLSIVVSFLLCGVLYAVCTAVLGISLAFAFCYYLLSMRQLPFMAVNFTDYYTSFLSIVFLVVGVLIILRRCKAEESFLKAMGHSIAHDVGAPITTAIVGVEIAQQALEQKKYKLVKKYLTELRESNYRAMQDVQVILSYISSVSGKRLGDWGKHSMLQCVSHSVGNYHMSDSQRKRLNVTNTHDFNFIGSPTLVRHIINNLLRNAFKYAGENAKIEIFINEEKRSIHVKDDGYGLEEELREKVFDRFVTTSGHGIGLSYCKEAVDLMDGEIKCLSKKNKGTEFIVFFN